MDIVAERVLLKETVLSTPPILCSKETRALWPDSMWAGSSTSVTSNNLQEYSGEGFTISVTLRHPRKERTVLEDC